jgi:hypothetical protein
MARQNEGRRLGLHASLRPQLDIWLVGWLVVFKSLNIMTLNSLVTFLGTKQYNNNIFIQTFRNKRAASGINPLKQELNSSVQRCPAIFFTGDFAS